MRQPLREFAEEVARRGIGIAARAGAGKSTLALHLLSSGLSFVSNDRLLIKAGASGPELAGIPKMPRVNPGTLLNLAAGVLKQARYPTATLNEILAAFRASLEEHAGDGGDCEAAFRHEGGRFVIDVSCGGGRTWRLTRPLPPAD